MAYEFNYVTTPLSTSATSIVFTATLSGYKVEIVGTGLAWDDTTNVLSATTITGINYINGSTVEQAITLDSSLTVDELLANFNSLHTVSSLMLGHDVVVGGATSDTLDGGAGLISGTSDGTRDTLNGGDGDDTYVLYDGDGAGILDYISDSSGTDTITSTIDRDLDYFTAQIENLTLVAGSDAVAGYGNDLNNVITGNSNDNILDGRDGADTLVGGAGNDTYYVRNYTDASNVSIVDAITEAASGGTDTVIANSSYTLASGVEVEFLQTKLSTGIGAFNLTGNSFAQEITGNAGDNRLDGGSAGDDSAVDTLIGGDGNDTYVIGDATTLDVVTENEDEGTDTVESSATVDLADFANVENVTLTGTGAADATGYDRLDGNGDPTVAVANKLVGNDGDNRLWGKLGSDTLTGGDGSDTFVFDGAGRDVVTDFVAADDTVDLTEMNIGEFETIQAIAFANGTSGENTILRTVANNTVSTLLLTGLTKSAMTSSMFTFETSTTADTFTGTAGNDYFFGAGGGDTLNGAGGSDYLFGEAGADTMNGGTGNDFMYGGAGDDTYVVDSRYDVVVDAGSGGTDTIQTSVTLALPVYTLAKEIENLQTTSAAGTTAINLTGNALANTITGNAGANVINGLGGADVMIGGGGNDTYYVDNASDTITETVGGGTADKMYTTVAKTISANVETLIANTGAGIALTGDTNAQTIMGGAGNNTISGKAGSDTLWGLGGSDVFVFDTAIGTDRDTLKDFNSAADTIRLENSVFTGLATGVLAATAFYEGTAAHDTTDRIIYNRTTGALSYDADGNGSGAAVIFAINANKGAITNADFVIV